MSYCDTQCGTQKNLLAGGGAGCGSSASAKQLKAGYQCNLTEISISEAAQVVKAPIYDDASALKDAAGEVQTLSARDRAACLGQAESVQPIKAYRVTWHQPSGRAIETSSTVHTAPAIILVCDGAAIAVRELANGQRHFTIATPQTRDDDMLLWQIGQNCDMLLASTASNKTAFYEGAGNVRGIQINFSDDPEEEILREFALAKGCQAMGGNFDVQAQGLD